ncbi:expressed unknown protein [Seminavis robusta]|uniref:Glycosyltransferase n=1 Tax=Seminavis robusta TaxID=568900 RepID=A0A9N8DJ64_9STRA|nr:expressed unknown protein [Seminavis robusta]|eukprot:Sro150_g068890.1 n/a (538) ;mRNA; f:72819-74432
MSLSRQRFVPLFLFMLVMSLVLFQEEEKFSQVFQLKQPSSVRHLANNTTVIEEAFRTNGSRSKRDKDKVIVKQNASGDSDHPEEAQSTSSPNQKADPGKTKSTGSLRNTVVSPDPPSEDATKKAAADAPAESNKADSSSSSSLPSKEERIAAFYKHHYEQVRGMAKKNSLMRWHDAGAFKSWANEFKYVPIKDENTNLEDANLQDHSFLYSFEQSLCTVAKVVTRYRQNNPNASWPHVGLVRFNADFGALSSRIPKYTGKFRSGPHTWKGEGCSMEFVLDYVNHPDTLAIITTQFQVMRHEKIKSIPLGIPRFASGHMAKFLKEYDLSKANRSDLIMVNVKPWGQRIEPMKQLLANFNASDATIEASISGKKIEGLSVHNVTEMTKPRPDNPLFLQNTYYLFQSIKGEKSMNMNYEQMIRSKFVWAPSGLGLDCYRIWESFYLGTIPVIAHLGFMETDGWMNETLRDLPVAWVEHHDQVTPEFLENAYEKIILEPPPGGYRYEKLTKDYWIDLAHSYLPPNSAGRRQRDEKLAKMKR